MRVEVGHCEGIDDGLCDFFDDVVETANVCPIVNKLSNTPHRQHATFFSVFLLVFPSFFPNGESLTFKTHGNLVGRNHFHGNVLLVARQLQILYPDSAFSPPSSPSPTIFIIVTVVAVVTVVARLSRLVRQYGAQPAIYGRRLFLCIFLLLSFRVEAGEQVPNDEIRY